MLKHNHTIRNTPINIYLLVRYSSLLNSSSSRTTRISSLNDYQVDYCRCVEWVSNMVCYAALHWHSSPDLELAAINVYIKLSDNLAQASMKAWMYATRCQTWRWCLAPTTQKRSFISPKTKESLIPYLPVTFLIAAHTLARPTRRVWWRKAKEPQSSALVLTRAEPH